MQDRIFDNQANSYSLAGKLQDLSAIFLQDIKFLRCLFISVFIRFLMEKSSVYGKT